MPAPQDPIKYQEYRNNISKDIWLRDNLVNNKLQILGFKVIRVWESDIKNDLESQIVKILELIKQESV